MGGRWLTTEEVERAVEMYAEGMTTTAIGEALGITAPTVRYRLRQRGVTMRPPGPRPHEDGVPLVYSGGWRRRGLILVPMEPAR